MNGNRTSRRPGKPRFAAFLGFVFVTATPGARPGVPTVPSAQATILRERRLHKANVGLSAEAPTGWGFSTQTGYPAVVFLLVHPDGSKLSVSLAKTKANDSSAFADENRVALQAAGFTLVREATTANGQRLFDLKPRRGGAVLRQIYTVHRPRPALPEERHEVDGGPPRAAAIANAGRSADADANEGLVVTLTTQEALLSAHDGDLFSLISSLVFDDEDR